MMLAIEKDDVKQFGQPFGLLREFPMEDRLYCCNPITLWDQKTLFSEEKYLTIDYHPTKFISNPYYFQFGIHFSNLSHFQHF